MHFRWALIDLPAQAYLTGLKLILTLKGLARI